MNIRPPATPAAPPTALVRAIDADGVVFDEFELLPVRTRPEGPAERTTAGE